MQTMEEMEKKTSGAGSSGGKKKITRETHQRIVKQKLAALRTELAAAEGFDFDLWTSAYGEKQRLASLVLAILLVCNSIQMQGY